MESSAYKYTYTGTIFKEVAYIDYALVQMAKWYDKEKIGKRQENK